MTVRVMVLAGCARPVPPPHGATERASKIMAEAQPILVTPPVRIMTPPDGMPAVVPANVDAALMLLAGALTALDQGGYEMEHTDGPYGEVYRATVAVIERAYPGIDAEGVLLTRATYDAGVEGILRALATGRRAAGL